MSLGTFLQTIITVVFIYLLLALIASEIQENIAAVFEMRAKRLRRSIQQMFGEKDGDEGLTEKLYTHPNITSLNQSGYRWLSIFGTYFNAKLDDKKIRRSVGPSYISDAELFAKTVSLIIKSNQNLPEKDQQSPKQSLENMSFESPACKGEGLLAQIANLSEGVKPDLAWAEFQTNLEKQYIEVQQRSSGVFKRGSKGLSLAIGFAIAIIVNADAFNIVSNLNKNNPNYTTQLIEKLDQSSDLFPKPTTNGEETITSNPGFTPEQKTKISDVINSIDIIPLGWDYQIKLKEQEQQKDKDQQSKKQLQIEQGRDALITTLTDSKKECVLDNPITIDPNNPITSDKIKELNEYASKCFESLSTNFSKEKNNLNFYFNHVNLTEQTNFLKQYKIINESPASQANFYITYEKLLKRLMIDRAETFTQKETEPIATTPPEINIHETVTKQGGLPKVFFGWLISAISISMGAPFWFDMLSKVMNVRNVGGDFTKGKK